jgi:taurine dioxygenase
MTVPTDLDDSHTLDVRKRLELRHLGRTIGTEVRGIDLRDELAEDVVAGLRQLLLERKALLFPDQDVTRDQHRRFARCFGPLLVAPESAPYGEGSQMEGDHEIYAFRRGKDNPARESYWHVDQPHVNPPIAANVVVMRKRPDLGGETVIADMTAAYDGLSPWLKDAITDLWAVHGYSANVQEFHPGMSDQELARWQEVRPPKAMPIVQTHPETGRRILYVSGTLTLSVVGLPRGESAMLIDHLARQASVPEYQCRFRYTDHTVGVWDNRSVQHYGCFDYPGQERILEGVHVLSERTWPGVD